MRMNEAMIACNRGGAIKVGPWPDESGWGDAFDLTFGACFADRHTVPEAMQVAMLFIDFQTVVTNYAIAVEDAHREFLKIDEYRWHISPDCIGAEEVPDAWLRLLLPTSRHA